MACDLSATFASAASVVSLIETFLVRGADPYRRDCDGKNCLQVAAGAPDHLAVRLLMTLTQERGGRTEGREFFTPDDCGNTPLHYACDRSVDITDSACDTGDSDKSGACDTGDRDNSGDGSGARDKSGEGSGDRDKIGEGSGAKDNSSAAESDRLGQIQFKFDLITNNNEDDDLEADTDLRTDNNRLNPFEDVQSSDVLHHSLSDDKLTNSGRSSAVKHTKTSAAGSRRRSSVSTAYRKSSVSARRLSVVAVAPPIIDHRLMDAAASVVGFCLLQSGADVNLRNRQGLSPLMLASCCNNHQVMSDDFI